MRKFRISEGRFLRSALFLWVGMLSHLSFAEEPGNDRFGSYPLIEFGLDQNKEARIHGIKIPPLKEGEFFGVRFKAPSWIKGNIAWMLLDLGGADPKPRSFETRLLDAGGKQFIIHKPHLLDVKANPRLKERFPGLRMIHYQGSHEKNRLKPDQEYVLEFRTLQGALPPMAVGITVTSEKGYYETGYFPLWDAPKARFAVAKDFVKEMMKLRETEGDEAVRLALTREFYRRHVNGVAFGRLFRACWIEAQVGSGREDLLWASRINDLIFQLSAGYGYFKEAVEIVPNLTIALGDAKRHGRRTEVLAWWAKVQETSGLSLNPATYPEKGGRIPELPEVRLREIPTQVPKLAKDFGADRIRSIPDVFDRVHATCFAYWAKDCARRGLWREALEWQVWVADWAEKEYLKKKSHELGNVWNSETFSISELLSQMGFEEGAMEYCRQIIQSDIVDGYGGRIKNAAQIKLLAWEIEQKLAPPSKLARIEELVSKLEKNRYNSVIWYRDSAATLASTMIALGSTEEGLSRLNGLAEKGNLRARWMRLQHWCRMGRVEGVEAEFLAHLNAIRSNGDKLQEAKVYSLYADFLEATDQFAKAVRVRQEAIRLDRAFHLFVNLPLDLAKYSSLLMSLGREQEARKASAEAVKLIDQKYRVPARVVKEVRRILDAKPAVVQESGNQSPEVTDLQPMRSVVIPVEGVPFENRLTVVNYSDGPISGVLRAEGLPVALKSNPDDFAILAELNRSGDSSVALTVEPGQFWMITFAGQPELVSEGEVRFLWEPKGFKKSWESKVEILKPDEGVHSSVIEAGEYRHNSFFGVMINHQYAQALRDAKTPLVRFVSSTPCRIEVYQGDSNKPLAIDANGNGTLVDSGDELFTDGNGNGQLLLPVIKNMASIQLVVFPKGEIPEEGMTIEFQVFSEDGWRTEAENRIVR